MTLFYLIILCCLTYSFEIVFGLAGTVLVMPLASSLYDVKLVIVYLLLPQLLTGSLVVLPGFKTMQWKKFFEIFLFASFGAVFGVVFFKVLDQSILKLILASVIVACGVFTLSSKSFSLSPVLQRIFDVVAGFFNALCGISGPIIATRMLGTFEDKTEVRNHLQLFFFSMNSFRLVGYLITDSIPKEVLPMWAWSFPFIVLALIVANRFHADLPNQVFKKVFSIVILFSGIWLFF